MESVILIHGLWMVGVDMLRLKKRITACGYKTYQFHYPSVRKSPAENAVKLKQFIDSLGSETIHLVAHSLGGLVVRHLVSRYPSLVNGKIVTLGTPHRNSAVARELVKSRFGRLLLGKSIVQGLLGNAPAWKAENKLGVIVGVGGIGIGRIIVRYTEKNDGSVMLSETKVGGMSDYLIIEKCGHIGLLYNKQVAVQACVFLKEGHFEHSLDPTLLYGK